MHYEGYPETFDEFVLLSDIRSANGETLTCDRRLRVGSKVLTLWGDLKDEYLASIVPWKTSEANTSTSSSATSEQEHLAAVYCGPIVKVRFAVRSETKDPYHRYIYFYIYINIE